MNILINILLIGLIVILILDVANFRHTIKQIVAWGLSKYLKISIKPESLKFNPCSLCISWWLSLLYIIIIGKLSFFLVFYALFIACLTPVLLNGVYLIIDTLNAIIIYLSNKIN